MVNLVFKVCYLVFTKRRGCRVRKIHHWHCCRCYSMLDSTTIRHPILHLLLQQHLTICHLSHLWIRLDVPLLKLGWEDIGGDGSG